MSWHGWQVFMAASRAFTQAERANATARNQEEAFLAALNEEVHMRQTSVPPARECSIPQASELGEMRKPVRTISPEEQKAVEQAPNFDIFCAWLHHLAKAMLAKRERPQPPEAA